MNQSAHLYPHAHPAFVALDSDGCVIDTMRVKQHEHIQPEIIKWWHLEPLKETLLACSEFVNMTSRTRGVSRLKALLLTFELFNAHPDTLAAGFRPIDLTDLRAFCASGLPLGAPALRDWLQTHPSAEIERILQWNDAVNHGMLTHMSPVPVFENARKALKLMRDSCDLMVVSQAPYASLVKEWGMHGILDYVPVIAGQEAGAKDQQITAATQSHYAPDQILMIGDATGDMLAADEAGVLFYPILPNQEENSWQLFLDEAYPKFMDRTYSGIYAQMLRERFLDKLPTTPPWMN